MSLLKPSKLIVNQLNQLFMQNIRSMYQSYLIVSLLTIATLFNKYFSTGEESFL